MKKKLIPLVEWFFRLDPRRKWRVNRFIRKNEVVKLQLGCWKNIRKGWLNTDKSISGCVGGAIYMDVGKRFLLPDESADFVYSEHLVEHLTFSQASNMLKECHRVMKNNGVIRIATPNMAFLLDLYLHPEKNINKCYVEWAAEKGHLPHMPVYVVSRFHTEWGHQIIYDYETLAELLQSCGFSDICRCEMSKSAHPELCNIEAHFNHMPYEFCCLETMILEARKA